MTSWFLFLSNIAAGGVRAAAYLFLVFRLLPCGRPNQRSMAAAIAGAAATAVLFPAAKLPDLCRMAAETVWFAVCACRFQAAERRMSLFVGIIYEISLSFWQFLIAAWVGVAFRSPVFLERDAGRGQIAGWLLHLLLAAGCLYLGKKELDRKKAFRLASVSIVAGFIAVITLSQQTVLTIAEDTLDMWTLLSIVLMMSVLVFNLNRQYEVEKELARLQSEQAMLLERDYTALNRAYAVNARLFHDFHNHIGILRQFLIHAKPEEALNYLDELQSPVREMTDTVWTGDETVDYLINSKAAAAKADGVQYQAQVEFPRHTNLRSADLCAILGNLLDNALEAARQVPQKEERFVRLTIRRIHQMLIIKVENSFAAPPVLKGGEPATSKTEDGLHGWGIKSARAAAEKYDGTVRISHTDHLFLAVASLSYQGVPAE